MRITLRVLFQSVACAPGAAWPVFFRIPSLTQRRSLRFADGAPTMRKITPLFCRRAVLCLALAASAQAWAGSPNTCDLNNGIGGDEQDAGSTAPGSQATACGDSNQVSGDDSNAFGSFNVAAGHFGTAMGYSNQASGEGSSAFGRSNVGRATTTATRSAQACAITATNRRCRWAVAGWCRRARRCASARRSPTATTRPVSASTSAGSGTWP